MEKKQIKKEVVLKSITKMVADKKAVRSYMKGETSLAALTQKGIRFGKPL